jgi:hypothetical protein
MRYIKTYERHYYDNYDITKNKIISYLLSVIRISGRESNKRGSIIADFDYYFDKGILWVICRYSAKNQTESFEKRDLYESLIINVIKKLKDVPYVKKVDYEYLGRMVPFKMNGNGLSRYSARDSNFEIRCYLKDDIVKELKDEFEVSKNANKYNL